MPTIARTPLLHGALVALGLAAASVAQAQSTQLTVTITNLAPANGLAFAPLRVGFGDGSFDAFNLGQVAGAPIVSVAEGGSGAAWFPAFAAADPGALTGTVGGLLLPGASAQAQFTVNTSSQGMFTFAAMVVPSNDFFIGNDDPMAYRLFNANGQLMMPSITVKAREIWDAGSEVFDPAAAAFVGNNDLRSDQNSVVAFNFAELSAFSGLATGAGYTFNSSLAADSDVYRIDFALAPVPEPSTYALLLAGLGLVAARRLRAQG
ncbi:spondin domain-containing protein [Roseateles sp. LYH14W]|uniref:Spondin domain-containing protein n=1 Tax=Pelomonas parva TaxID=3299032 RepID=A0ABW7F0A6_9BURK